MTRADHVELHSESLIIQEVSLPFFKASTRADTYDFALKHCEMIKRFNRFPYRDQILVCPSTPE